MNGHKCDSCVYGVEVLNGWSREFVCQHPEGDGLKYDEEGNLTCWAPARTGTWKYVRDPAEIVWFRDQFHCSACGEWVSQQRGRTDFCPYCGAKMLNSDRAEKRAKENKND